MTSYIYIYKKYIHVAFIHVNIYVGTYLHIYVYRHTYTYLCVYMQTCIYKTDKYIHINTNP